MAKTKTNSTAATVSPLVSKLTEAELAKLMTEGVQSAEVMSLEIGESFRGALIDRGAPVDTTDSITGEPKQLLTWRFKHPSGATVDILSCHQLEKDLAALVGEPDVFIMRMDKKDIGGKMVNQYKVIHFPAKN
tara:strand:- start:22510 stop:22908 length:399 start_codon:yes stop_codon:yes gene_type:complete